MAYFVSEAMKEEANHNTTAAAPLTLQSPPTAPSSMPLPHAQTHAKVSPAVLAERLALVQARRSAIAAARSDPAAPSTSAAEPLTSASDLPPPPTDDLLAEVTSLRPINTTRQPSPPSPPQVRRRTRSSKGDTPQIYSLWISVVWNSLLQGARHLTHLKTLLICSCLPAPSPLTAKPSRLIQILRTTLPLENRPKDPADSPSNGLQHLNLPNVPILIVGSICAVSSSLNVGKAGPLAHTGACIAALVGQGGSKKFRLTWKWLRFFKNDRDRRDFVTCGCAAGIAAAFRAPVGGLLFAFEEMASWWRSALLWRAFFTTAVVAIVLRALIDVCLRGECGLFGKGGLIMYDVTSANIAYQFRDVPAVLLLAVLGGILGSIYNFLLEKVLQVYNLINKKGVLFRILLACSLSIFTSCLLFGLPWLASCRACPSDTSEPCPTIGRSGNYKKFQCSPGYYNDLASLFFNTNDDAIKNLFSKNTDAEFHISSMLIFFATCFFLSVFSYGIVAPAGLFVPVIVTGAAYGRFVGMLVGSYSSLNHGLFAVLGAASLLGGSMRMTVSLCVIILELTNNLLLLPLIMLVLLISKTAADAFNGNIYDLIMKLKGLPYLESHAEPYMRQLTAGDVVTGPLQIFHGFEKVGNVVHVLKTTGHNGFPVVDEPPVSVSPVLVGLILRSHLLTLLKSKAFLPTPAPAGPNAIVQFSSDDFAKKGLGHGDNIEDINLSEEDLEMYIDLHPFTNTSPYAVVETMSLAKALILFREVGLRHLLVIPNVSGRVPVVGILTRHDFMPAHILKLHPMLVQNRWKRLRFRFPKLSKLI